MNPYIRLLVDRFVGLSDIISKKGGELHLHAAVIGVHMFINQKPGPDLLALVLIPGVVLLVLVLVVARHPVGQAGQHQEPQAEQDAPTTFKTFLDASLYVTLSLTH